MLFTVGYNNLTRRTLITKIEELNAALVDIRLRPFSYSPFWTQKQLKIAFGKRYFHIQEFGNLNYNTNNPFKIVNIEEGLEKFCAIKNEYEDIFLLCACKDFQACHRSLITEEILKIFDIVHEEFDPNQL